MASILYIPEEIRETISHLEYVGGVTSGQKLFFKEMIYVSETDYFKRYRRYREGENIELQLDILKNIFKTYLRIKNSYDELFLKKLDKAYEKFVNGICVLSVTYKDNSKLNNFCNLIIDHRKMKILPSRE